MKATGRQAVYKALMQGGRHKDRQTDSQPDRPTDKCKKYTNGQSDKLTNRQTEKQTYRQTEKTNIQINRQGRQRKRQTDR
jgi:hypothetical protein